MASLDNLQIISQGHSENPPADSYILLADQGHVFSDHNLTEGNYEIVHYQIHPELRGKKLNYGKELLRAAHEHAIAVGGARADSV